MDLSNYTQPQLDKLTRMLNLTGEELEIFKLLSKKKSIYAISVYTSLSESTVSRRIRTIKGKMQKLKEDGEI